MHEAQQTGHVVLHLQYAMFLKMAALGPELQLLHDQSVTISHKDDYHFPGSTWAYWLEWTDDPAVFVHHHHHRCGPQVQQKTRFLR